MNPNKDRMLLAVFVVIIIAAVIIGAGNKTTEDVSRSSYNSDKKGTKAFYTLLSDFNYPVERYRLPFFRLKDERGIMILALDTGKEMLVEDDANYLFKWVKKGNTAIIFNPLKANASSFIPKSGIYGKGEVLIIETAKDISNHGMRNQDNAVKYIKIIDEYLKPGDKIYFDEFYHGHIAFGEIAKVGKQVWVALGILCICGLLLLHTRGKRFGEVRPLESDSNRRAEFEYVQALAGIFKRAHASDTAATILNESFRNRLNRKIGIPQDADIVQIAQSLKDYGVLLDNDMVELMKWSQKPSGSKSNEKLISLAKGISQIEEELGIARIH